MADERTDRLQFMVAIETIEYLKDLALLGTHGATHNAVARSLIEEGIRRAIKDEFIKIRKSPSDADKEKG